MGNDGGSIPTRRELVKSAARNPTVSELKATAHESLSHAWTHDALNSDPLDLSAVVSDWRGRLYNYETVLQGLMPALAPAEGEDGEQPKLAAAMGIRSLRDVVRLQFTRYTPPDGAAIWACPVTLKELGPSTRAVYLVPCGHVVAEAAIRSIPSGACPVCSASFAPENVIPVLPTEAVEIERLQERVDTLAAAGLSHNLKKDKGAGGKKKRKAAETAEADGKAVEKAEKGEEGKADKPKAERLDQPVKKAKQDISSRINNPMTASLTAKVLAEQDAHNKRRKLAAVR